tara:strand:- start:203 stop:502 length:300 start_codon:yes stop_codon:yes gene_type:complete
MKHLRDKLRGPRALPALLLAALLGVFVAVQTEGLGHLHGADDPVGDCSQCQHYSGHAVVSSSGALPVPTAAAPRALQPARLTPVSIRYHLQARGPPAVS